MTSKLKAISLNYRQAVDSGKRSGHGRVVLLYFELCEKVWGGSPATEQIVGGVESTDLCEESDDIPTAAEGSNESARDDDDEGTQSDDTSTRETSGEPSDASLALQSTVQKRRQYLDKKLDNYRQKKLKRKPQ